MRLKHNKKRNTAFLYEALIGELTKAAVEKREDNKKKILSLIKEFFAPSTILGKELLLYKTLNETKGLDLYTAERLVQEVRDAHTNLDQKKIFERQSILIKKINKVVSPKVFSNFVPNYKSLATISQMFTSSPNPKERVLLERRILQDIVATIKEGKDSPRPMLHTDKLVYRKFISNFNEKYGEQLIPEQKELMRHFLCMFEDNGLSFKMYLNEEVARLKEGVIKMHASNDVREDTAMSEKISEVHQNHIRVPR